MITTHTPGRWHVNAIKSGRIVGDETADDFDKLQINCTNMTIATVYRRRDARLIASAPELMEALQELLAMNACNYDRGTADYTAGIANARAAIDKATGKVG